MAQGMARFSVGSLGQTTVRVWDLGLKFRAQGLGFSCRQTYGIRAAQGKNKQTIQTPKQQTYPNKIGPLIIVSMFFFLLSILHIISLVTVNTAVSGISILLIRLSPEAPWRPGGPALASGMAPARPLKSSALGLGQSRGRAWWSQSAKAWPWMRTRSPCSWRVIVD